MVVSMTLDDESPRSICTFFFFTPPRWRLDTFHFDKRIHCIRSEVFMSGTLAAARVSFSNTE